MTINSLSPIRKDLQPVAWSQSNSYIPAGRGEPVGTVRLALEHSGDSPLQVFPNPNGQHSHSRTISGAGAARGSILFPGFPGSPYSTVINMPKKIDDWNLEAGWEEVQRENDRVDAEMEAEGHA